MLLIHKNFTFRHYRRIFVRESTNVAKTSTKNSAKNGERKTSVPSITEGGPKPVERDKAHAKKKQIALRMQDCRLNKNEGKNIEQASCLDCIHRL